MATSTTGLKRERRRRSHIRTFTGCLQCRQRHVKCDETRPTCANCSRMNIACSAYSFIIDMQVSTPRSLEAARKRKNASSIAIPISRSLSSNSRDDYSPTSTTGSSDMLANAPRSYTLEHHVMSPDDDGDETIPGQLILKPSLDRSDSERDRLSPDRQSQSGQVPAFAHHEPSGVHVQPTRLLASASPMADEQFLSHFLINVSALLIVFDHPFNSNPYRFFFPFMAARSEPLREAMNALGALHMANTTAIRTDLNLEVMAVTKYAQTVRSLREKLSRGIPAEIADLATCLLLVFFEMMDARSSTWKHHLIGAREIYEGLCNRMASHESWHSSNDLESALRTFLISTLAHLDVSASLSSAQPTLIPGAYWETPEGWEYNLGVPCLRGFSREEIVEDHHLAGVRAVKSSLMLIQSDLGTFAQRLQTRQSVSPQEIDSIYSRLDSWRAQLPDIFSHLNHPSRQLFPLESIEAAMTVRCSEQATTLYVHQLVGATTDDLASQVLIDSILSTVQRLPRDARQFGSLWALFIAGSATADVYQQTFVRSRLQGMRSFGMRNVDQALEVLETVWQRLQNGMKEARWFIVQQELACQLLLT